MDNLMQRKAAVLAKIAATKADKTAAESERDTVRADLMTVLGSMMARKTIWALIPQNIRDVAAKYTGAAL